MSDGNDEQRGANGWWLYDNKEHVPAWRSAQPMVAIQANSTASTRVGFTYDPREVIAWVDRGELPAVKP